MMDFAVTEKGEPPMICKDCIHDDVCEHWKNSVFGSDALYPKENDCKHFKNKADYVKVKHGKLIAMKTEFGWNCCEYPVKYMCSECGRTIPQEEPYCHCGAQMDVTDTNVGCK